MFDMIRKIWQVGTVTRQQPFVAAPPRYRGKIVLKEIAGTNWDSCLASCPTGALFGTAETIELCRGNCIMCGACVEICNTAAIVQTNDGYLAADDKDKLYQRIWRKGCDDYE